MIRLLFRLKLNLLVLKSDSRGQATVEYLIVALAFLVIFIVLAALAGRLQGGMFVDHAINSASHAFGHNTMGSIGDVLLY